ncbi:hypothetical protein TWF103_002218 [Orbilia oligospora]|uniref:Uncharacterized protein n=1 Tax=Orbilia oligospora TaxID=2813651 RepID=A0A7C8NQE5_ORBOL|nr:hypothetical protein TWF103_002218 [Orbilia oligospora]KAF3126111.1 hypothetical protein TWF703_010572 [Orbilia oligospora]
MSNGPPNLGNGTAIPFNTFQQNIANGNANNQTSAMNGSRPPNQVAPSSSGLRRALTERQINVCLASRAPGPEGYAPQSLKEPFMALDN